MKLRYFVLALLIGVTAHGALVPNHEQQIQLNIENQLVTLANTNITLVSRLFNTVWNDPTIPPCQVFSDLGANAAALRISLANFKSFLSSVGASLPVTEPAGYVLVNNNDGTVTCTSPSPSPSPTPGP